jgi:hypothetical protein
MRRERLLLQGVRGWLMVSAVVLGLLLVLTLV